MDREDKLLAKSLIFAGGFLFAILSFITLIQTSNDFSAAKASGNAVLKNANLTPLLVVFFLVTILAVTLVIGSFILTFIKSDKAKVWQGRLLICTIIMLVLSVALYAIMAFSSYIDFASINEAVQNNSTDKIVRKFYTSKFTSAMMLTSISLIVNLFLIQNQSKFEERVEETIDEKEPEPEQNNEQAELENQIKTLKEQIKIKELKNELANLTSQLDDQPNTTETTSTVETQPSLPIDVDANQINIEEAIINEANIETSEPIIDRVINAEPVSEDIVQEDEEIKEFEEILGLPENDNI